MESTICDTTTASRATTKNEERFHECVRVKFHDDTGAYRLVLLLNSQLALLF